MILRLLGVRRSREPVQSHPFAARLALGSAVAFAVISCSHDCTLIGCNSGLTVMLSSRPVGPFTIEVLVPNGQGLTVLHSYECASPTCSEQTRIPDATPARVLVRVTTQMGVKDTELSDIVYDRTYPNGTDCDPLCIAATVVAQPPG